MDVIMVASPARYAPNWMTAFANNTFLLFTCFCFMVQTYHAKYLVCIYCTYLSPTFNSLQERADDFVADSWQDIHVFQKAAGATVTPYHFDGLPVQLKYAVQSDFNNVLY